MSVGDIMAKKNYNKKGASKADKKKAVSNAKRDLVYYKNDSSDEISKLVKIVLLVTGIMIIFYLVTVFVTRKVDAVKTAKLGKDDSKASIQYDSVIIGSMLKMDGKYYVLIEKSDDDKIDDYSNMLKSIAANDDAPKVQPADLSSSFNNKYLSDEKDDSSDLEKFKVTGTTLVEVDNHEIVSTYDNYDSIKDKLHELE